MGVFAAFILLAVLCTSCTQESVRIIEKTRVVDLGSRTLRWDAISTERFGIQPRGSSHHGTRPGAGSAFRWKTPYGWRELPSTRFRAVNFMVAGDNRAECYLTVLPGDGGGLLANINRWRKQMSLRATTEAEVAALPKRRFFGRDATEVDFEGTHDGRSGYRLVGLLLIDKAGSRFLKMVAPKSIVKAELRGFHALAESLRASGGGPAGGGSSAGADGLTWKAPAGWQRGPQRQMRAVTLFVGGDKDTECYITILPGDGGRPLPNINRWRGQMGQRALTADEFDKLTRIPMLGGQGIVVEISGNYQGMSGGPKKDAALMGVICNLPNRSIFVKMIGPKSSVLAAKDDFTAFCKSIQRAQ